MFVLHFVADFLLQSREMGRNKSKQIGWLAIHLAIQAVVFSFGLSMVIGIKSATWFAVINTAIHGLIDWNIWRLYVKSVIWRRSRDGSFKLVDNQYPYWEDPVFYATIGFDQMLHFLTLAVLWMNL